MMIYKITFEDVELRLVTMWVGKSHVPMVLGALFAANCNVLSVEGGWKND